MSFGMKLGFVHEFKNLEWNGDLPMSFGMKWGFAHEFKNLEWNGDLPMSLRTQNGTGICQQVFAT